VLPYDRGLTERSQELRKNLTTAEKFLWSKIRAKQIKGCWFYRQKPVGEYIADFYCPKAKLIVEVDGSHHLLSEVSENDLVRDKYMEGIGLHTIRFTNKQVLANIQTVLKRIESELPE
jgi:very-short-patch-repair endonuclease